MITPRRAIVGRYKTVNFFQSIFFILSLSRVVTIAGLPKYNEENSAAARMEKISSGSIICMNTEPCRVYAPGGGPDEVGEKEEERAR